MYLRITKTGGQNQVGGQVVLGGVVSNSSVLTGLVVVTEIGYNGYAAFGVARKDIACFEKSLEVTGVDGNAKGILVPGRTISAVGTLSPRTFLIKHFYAKLCKELRGGPCFPAVHEDVATGKGLIQKARSEEHTSELQSRPHLVCRLLLEKKKNKKHLEHRHSRE